MRTARQAGAMALAIAVVAMLWGPARVADAGTLPDGRGYELVSPPDKNGGNVMTDSARFRVADDGDAVGFASLTAFADALGTGIATDYLSIRRGDPAPGTNGWGTHSITPPQGALSVDSILSRADPLYVGDFSSHLDQGVFSTWTPLTGALSVAGTVNLYLRDNLLTPGQGFYELLTACPLCDLNSSPLPALEAGVSVPVYGGASRDFGRILFESRYNLTADAPAQPGGCTPRNAFACRRRVYEWSDGQVQLAGLVPASTSDISCGGSAPPCVAAVGSVIGNGLGGYPGHAISSDGSRIFFAVNSGAQSGRLYVRNADGTTDEVGASERTDCAGDPSCGGDGVPDPAPDAFQNKTFAGASVDGSRVFFITGEALTDDAPVGADQKLYMYDTTKAASDPHNLTLLNVDGEPADVPNSVKSVIAMSDDGRYVYFQSSGQLVAGEPLLGIGRGIYLWHDGEIAYVGQTVVDESLDFGLARTTADGHRLLFAVHNGSGFSLGADHGSCLPDGCRELYLYNADTHTLACASCSPVGEPPTTDTATTGVHTNASASATTWHRNRAISDDGSRVFFTTGEGLLPEDTNGKLDVYEYDVPTRTLHLITSGKDPFDSYFMDSSPDGRDVFFVTHERLVGWDTDESYDLYDARVGGGFPDPLPPAAGCARAACHDAPAPAPSDPRVGSSTFDGAGNVAAALKPHRTAKACRKDFVKRRVRGKRRCVKRKRRHARHAAKRAGIQQRRSK